jgi:hypothetical protein
LRADAAVTSNLLATPITQSVERGRFDLVQLDVFRGRRLLRTEPDPTNEARNAAAAEEQRRKEQEKAAAAEAERRKAEEA